MTLFVSSGTATVTIPFDITTGQNSDAVQTELKNLGFVVNPQLQSNAAPAGTVFDSNPKPGTSAPVGSTVTIFVSSGPAPIGRAAGEEPQRRSGHSTTRAERIHEPGAGDTGDEQHRSLRLGDPHRSARG